jgi:hypothetical protein
MGFARSTWATLCLVGLAAAGCGGDAKGLVLVSGQATYAGGEWPMPGTITFTPLESGASQPARPGSARFNADGKFVVGSYQPGDGLMPGKYHVTISCIDPLDFSKPREVLEFVPADYRPDDLVVEAGQDAIELKYDVPKKQ